jgi:hypothetical protein
MPCNFFNKSPIWINLNQDICIDGLSYKKEKDINPRSKTYNTVRNTKRSKKPCPYNCNSVWKYTGIEECVDCYSRKQQTDGCGNTRWILVNEGKCNNVPNWVETTIFTCFQSQSRVIERDVNPCSNSYNDTRIGRIAGNACALPCVPNWINYAPYIERCEEGVSEIYQQDGCGNFRWIEGGNACSTDLTTSTFLAYVSYNTYVGNTATNNLFTTTKDLYNAMYTSMFTGETIVSTFKFNNSVLSLGDSIYINNTIVSGNAYIGYFEGNNMKYIKITSGVVSEIGSTLTASTISETKVLFPYFTKTNSGDTGYGFLPVSGAFWKARTRIGSDNLTINYLFSQSENGNQFDWNDGTYNYQVRPYFRIGRNAKIYGVPNNYVIPDMYRGTWIELLCSVEVFSVKSPSETNEQFEIRKGNVETNFNAVFHLLVGR